MSTDLSFVGVGLASFLLSVCAPFVLRPWLEGLGVVDIASARSSHVGTVVRGLGLACVVAYVVVSAVSFLVFEELKQNPLSWIVLLMGIAAGSLGWMEDLRGVSVLGRFSAQVLIGTVATWAMVVATDVSPWFILVGTVGVPVLVNATNFMDGVNGISGLYGLVAGGYFALLGAAYGQLWLLISGVVVAGAYVGFLPWNFGWLKWSGAFMGDAGSYLLGGALAGMALGAFFVQVPIESVMAPFLVYLADTGFTLARRMIEGKRWMQPHREHAYQRLTDVGFSHVASALTVIGFTVVTCVLGSMGAAGDDRRLNEAAVATVAVVLIYLLLPWIIRILKKKTSTARRARP
jgi:UDP-N-acetylmuramyl pentapeptide phosphotransferase/UDP-N-acetylglucosamine-1-phosphate transferase